MKICGSFHNTTYKLIMVNMSRRESKDSIARTLMEYHSILMQSQPSKLNFNSNKETFLSFSLLHTKSGHMMPHIEFFLNYIFVI